MYPRKNFFRIFPWFVVVFLSAFLENIAVPHQTMFNSGKLGNYKNHWKDFFLGILVIYLKRILLLVTYCTVKVQSIIYAIFSGNYLEGLSLFINFLVFQSTKPYLPISSMYHPNPKLKFLKCQWMKVALIWVFSFSDISDTHLT